MGGIEASLLLMKYIVANNRGHNKNERSLVVSTIVFCIDVFISLALKFIFGVEVFKEQTNGFLSNYTTW